MNDLIEKQKNDVAGRFRIMADRIDHNADSNFGGAVVIYPPANGGEAVELLLLDLQADPAQFWQTIDFRIKLKLAELDDKRRNQQAFGGMR